MCSPRYPHTVAMEGRHIGLPLRWMNAVGRYIGLLGIHIGLPLLFLAACTQDDIAPAYPDAPLTITATIPGDVWAVATRAEGEGTVTYSDWKLHYTNYRGEAATGTLTATLSQDGTYTLTSGSDLVWAKVQDTQDADETFCLTCVGSDGATYYATTTAAHGAQAVAFNDAMTPTLAKLTVNFTLSHNMAQVNYSDFTISVTAKAAKTSIADEVVYNPMTHGGTWPAAEGDAATTAFTLSQQSAATGTYTITGSMLLPQQTMGETMTVEYNNGTVNNFEDDISWTLDLSAVAVTGGEEGQKANWLIAGQHLTLNLSTSIHTVDAPSDIQIEAFTAADADDYTPDLGGVAKTYEYDADNNTYYIYHEKFIEAALADRAANHPEAAVVSKAATLAIVDGAETDLAAVKAAIAGKSTVIVTGEEVDYIRSAISNSGAAEGSINLILADATAIGDNAFFECSALKSVSAPKATSIGGYAFTQCSALESVSLPAATSIGGGAFDGCSALTSVELPAATSIGEIAFAFCSVLTSVSLPEATSIGENAFYNCAALESVSLPAAQTIGDCAFQECIALKSVSLPTAETIGNAAFRICSALTSVSLPAAETIGNSAFNGCTALTSVSLPEATTIGDNAFDGCIALKSVSLPDVTEIGIFAFQACTALTSVSAPVATTIGDYAFYACTALTSVSLPAATTIGDGAFAICNALTSVSLPAAETIGENAFYNCTSLTSVSLPAATTIGDCAFQECIALTSVSLPAAETIGNAAFRICSALTSVSLPEATTIGLNAFASCTSLTSVSLPAATSIGHYAFSSCSALTSVSLPAAETIGNAAFRICSALTSVSLPAATTIGDNAFDGCSALKSVSLPDVTEIGIFAFDGCTALQSLTFGSVIESVGTDAFSRVPTENCDLTLAAGQQHMTVASSEVPSTPNGTPVTAADASADAAARTWAGATWKSITLK